MGKSGKIASSGSTRSNWPSAYAVRNARWRRFRKRIRAFLSGVNSKGHEHITLMIASHSANTPVFTLRISKYIILFMACLLALTVTLSVAAFIEKSSTDPEIRRLDLLAEACEETLDKFSRSVRTLESGMSKFGDNLQSFTALLGARPMSRIAPFGGVTVYPDGRDALPDADDSYSKDIRRLDRINLDIVRADQHAERARTLIYALRPYVRFQFFRAIERDPKSFKPSFWPCDNGGSITSPFGQRYNFFIGQYATHNAVDIANNGGTIIRATAPGVVTRVDNEPGGYGLWVEIKHNDGYFTRYGHMEAQEVFTGDLVYQGQIIGRMGHTGLATGDHVHYEVVKDGECLDPEEFMENKFKPGALPQP